MELAVCRTAQASVTTVSQATIIVQVRLDEMQQAKTIGILLLQLSCSAAALAVTMDPVPPRFPKMRLLYLQCRRST
jgi:hypothetical protein